MGYVIVGAFWLGALYWALVGAFARMMALIIALFGEET